MKNWLKMTLCGLTLGLAGFGLTGCTTQDLDNIQFRYNEDTGYVQYLVDSEGNWKNIIQKDQLLDYIGDDIKGNDGKNGKNGSTWYNGTSYPTNAQVGDYFLNTTNGNVYKKTSYDWSYQICIKGRDGTNGTDGTDGTNGRSGSVWHSGTSFPFYAPVGDYFLDIITNNVYKKELSDWVLVTNIKGGVGKNGQDLTAEKITVSFDVDLPEYMYECETQIASLTTIKPREIKKGDWCQLEIFDTIRIEDRYPYNKLSDYFLGWYIGEGINETKITSYTSINSNCTLKAKWNYDLIDKEYTSYGVKITRIGNDPYATASMTRNCGKVVHVAKNYRGYPIKTIYNINFGANIEKIILPASANISGVGTFDFSIDGYPRLKEVEWYGEESMTEIGGYAFFGCSELKTINIPNSVKAILGPAFKGCTSLENFDCCNVETIGVSTFEECNSLSNVDLRNVKTIGENAFKNCSKLKTSSNGWLRFYITECVETIGSGAFEGCTSLTEIYINSTSVANLTNNDSCLFTYANIINIKKRIVTDATAYIDDSQGNYKRQVTEPLASHDVLNRVEVGE